MMEDFAYKEMAECQYDHWWYKGRRDIIRLQLERLVENPTGNILEIGCGTGGNLSMLSGFGRVFACEMDEYARDFSINSSGIDVKEGWLPDKIPFKESMFDTICLFDVLEHIEDDKESLISLVRHLTPSGKVIITVPAGQWLFGRHDRNMHHYRRYSSQGLVRVMEESGLDVCYITYFNTLLFPLAVFARFTDWIFKKEKSSGCNIPPKLLNRILLKIFCFEGKLLKSIRFNFGLSLLCVGKVKC